MACVNQTRPHYVNQMGKTHSKTLAERHGHGTVCVNPPLLSALVHRGVGPSFIRSRACIFAPSRAESTSTVLFYGFYNPLVFSRFKCDACTDYKTEI
jgi:hypothetical protein